MKKLLLLCTLVLSLGAKSQNTDTISVMAYNLLNFPNVNSGRISYLKTIVQEVLPDVLMVCELTSSTGANSVLNQALNQNGISYYQKATYVTGPDTQNMLYYNSNKLGLKEQNVISTTLRDINEYVLYYKSDDIATTSDTTFFYTYVCHLKASQGEEVARNNEALAMKSYMAGRAGLENVLVGGDFNLYGSSEPAWTTITTSNGVTLVDPINMAANWHADFGYASVHTQSTRTASLDGGSTGGLDDRFDFIFMSPDLQNWGNQAKYISGTYWAYGQDGDHYNAAMIDLPTNLTVPANVVDALYYMSDHLPVYMEIEVQKAYNGIEELNKGIEAYYNANLDRLIFHFLKDDIHTGAIAIYDPSGKLVQTVDGLNEDQTIDVSGLERGLYILKEEKYNFSMKFIK
ncbi:MAG: T9SS type A sorting domain-containing protein [Crocinitomicaceae bacterium]|nr:T9SS type A sorting domain-containing protein [Crocinitomicaceae bacterium]